MHYKFQNMHFKTPKHLQQSLKLLKIRAYFNIWSNFLIQCNCQKVFSRVVKWSQKNFAGKKEEREEKFSKIEILILKKVYFSNLD